ncbi:MAG: hypothetical protein AABX11_02710 [Nanoarchaeota archaeon]
MKVLLAVNYSPATGALRDMINLNKDTPIIYPAREYDSKLMYRVLREHSPSRVLMDINYGLPGKVNIFPVRNTAKLMKLIGLDIQTQLLGIGETVELVNLVNGIGIPTISKSIESAKKMSAFLKGVMLVV